MIEIDPVQKLTCRVTQILDRKYILRYMQFDNCNKQLSLDCLGLHSWHTSLAGNSYSHTSTPVWCIHIGLISQPCHELVVTSQGVELCCQCSSGEPFWSYKSSFSTLCLKLATMTLFPFSSIASHVSPGLVKQSANDSISLSPLTMF